MKNLASDLVLGLRNLVRAPGLGATIVLTVGLGLGATTAMFAVVHAVLVSPLPYPDPDRLVRIYTDSPPHRFQLSVADYLALDEQQTSFSEVAGYTWSNMAFHRGEVAERVSGKLVSGRYFTLLGIHPAQGRALGPADDVPGGRSVVVVSHGFASRYLGGAAAALGQNVRLNGQDAEVVGVLPAEVGPLEQHVDVFAPARWQTPPRKGPFFITALGRRRPGVSAAAADDELAAIDRRIFPIWQSSYQDQRASWATASLRDFVVRDAGTTLELVLAAVALVLLIASTNAVNLLVARTARRQRELAVRGALGASWWRLLQHLLVESSLLAAGAAVVGLGLAAGAARLLVTVGARYIPRAAEISLDGPVLAFLAFAALASGLLFGLVPALAGARSRLDRSLASGGRSATGAPGARRLRRALVAGQFAVATPLLIASGLLLTSLVKLQRVDPGFDPDNLWTAALMLPAESYPEAADVRTFWERAKREVEALPGVDGVAFADGRPPRGVDNYDNFDLEDHPTPPDEPQPSVPWVSVTPEYFRLLGIPRLAGRSFDERDGAEDAPETVVVDRAWADRFFPGQKVLGRRFHEGGSPTWTTVVGVVGEVKYSGLERPDPGTVYWPMAERPLDHPIERITSRFAYLVVRTSVDPPSVAPAIRGVLRRLDPELPITEVATMNELLAGSLEQPRLLSILVAAFAVAALMLSVIGIHGVLAYFVQQQSREIGIRIALGGRPASVRRRVVGQGMGMAAAGLAVGIAAALALTRYLSSLLFEIRATDPPTFAAVAAAMLAVAFVACLAPARQAAAVDPVTALRAE